MHAGTLKEAIKRYSPYIVKRIFQKHSCLENNNYIINYIIDMSLEKNQNFYKNKKNM